GVDKNGEEWYQIEIGGNQGQTRTGTLRPDAPASLGKVIGPSVARAEIPDVIERLIEVYLARREGEEERFVDCVHRLGVEPFKQHVYGNAHKEPQHRQPERAAA
ncbi:MAG: nitrite/sulfite reductase, partial [Burkholderiales bacterium]